MALVISSPLEELLRRRTDNAYIVECDKHFHKKVSLIKAPKFSVIRREEGLEKHYNWQCKECQALIAYQCFDRDDLIGGPGTGGKQDFADDKLKRRHLYICSYGEKVAVVGNA